MKRVSLSSLAVNAPPPKAESVRAAPRARAGQGTSSEKVNKITSDEDNELGNRVQVAFRMDKDAYKDLKRMALDEDTTVNELVVRSINALREGKGLKKLPA
jgi:hypothetical protein